MCPAAKQGRSGAQCAVEVRPCYAHGGCRRILWRAGVARRPLVFWACWPGRIPHDALGGQVLDARRTALKGFEEITWRRRHCARALFPLRQVQPMDSKGVMGKCTRHVSSTLGNRRSTELKCSITNRTQVVISSLATFYPFRKDGSGERSAD